MASVSGGYTTSILFNGYTPADTQRLVCHPDSRILFTEKAIYKDMDFEQMPQLLAELKGAITSINDKLDTLLENGSTPSDTWMDQSTMPATMPSRSRIPTDLRPKTYII